MGALHTPPPPPLPFACSTAAPIPLLRRMSSSRPRTDRSARSAVASDKGSLSPSLLVIVGVKIDTLCRSPPHPRSVAPPSPTPARATVLAPRAGTTYLLLHHSSPLLLHRLRRPPPARCTPPPVTPARRSVAPLCLPLMPPPELGGVLVKIEMRRKAAASHKLLNRHLGECIPPPQSPRVPPGTRPPTLQRQDFFFLDCWRAVGGPKVVQIRPQTTYRVQETHPKRPLHPPGSGARA